MFYSAGRSIHAGFCTLGDREVHVRELFPGFNGADLGNPNVSMLPDDDAVLLNAGSYDSVVLSNVLIVCPHLDVGFRGACIS